MNVTLGFQEPYFFCYSLILVSLQRTRQLHVAHVMISIVALVERCFSMSASNDDVCISIPCKEL